jgi:hypothetical protein
MRFGKIDSFIWFGSGHLLYSSVLALKKRNFGVAVFSGDRHLHEVIDARGQTLAQALEEGNIDYFSSPDINRDQRLPRYMTPTLWVSPWGQPGFFGPWYAGCLASA